MPHAFIDFAKSFFDYAGKRAVIAFALVFTGAVLDGVGLLMLVPFLEVFAGTEPSRVSRWVTGFLAGLNITSKEGQLLVAMAGFIALVFLRNVIAWLRDTRVRRLTQGFVDSWRARIFGAVAYAPWQKVLEYQRTDLEHAINSDVSRLNMGTDRILRGSIVVIMMVVQIAIALMLSPMLTGIVLLFILLAGLLLLPTLRRARDLGVLMTTTGRKSHKVLGHFLAGLKLAKAHRAEGTYVQQYIDAVAQSRIFSLKFMSDQALYKAIFQFVSAVVVCLVILVGLFYLEVAVPTLVVVLIIMGRLTSPFLTLVQSVQSFSNMLPAFKTLQDMERDLSAGRKETAQSTANIGSIDQAPVKIEFKDVSFGHAGQDAIVLDKASFVIEPGKITALLGPSGSGKTTIVDLISGLLTPVSGAIFFQGAKADFEDAGRFGAGDISYIPQDPFLFDLTIRENLLWPRKQEESEISDEQIWETLKLVGAEGFIRKTPDALNARAGERGQSFSGGERQRLCLARALLNKPKLLILDEATNAVDMGLESELLSRLSNLRGHTTIIIITHRHESVANVDRLLTIDNGKVLVQ